MKIDNFKKYDVVTRNERSKHKISDGSYMGDRMVFFGYKDNIITLEHEEFGAIILSGAEWIDGWAYYPDELVEEINRKTKQAH